MASQSKDLPAFTLIILKIFPPSLNLTKYVEITARPANGRAASSTLLNSLQRLPTGKGGFEFLLYGAEPGLEWPNLSAVTLVEFGVG